MPRLAVLSVLSAASSPCPDLNLIHYTTRTRRALPPCLIFILIHYKSQQLFFKHLFLRICDGFPPTRE
ncbi:hypothetical protein NM96_02210 [Neisseria mucosa]|uniref:Secreted protein n=1 Tax=Neisseria mucosa TaxID=488 RepID=A0ABM6JC26_NEIMU|nr:hypothetical protein A6J88_07555 [Neisseria mucosa]AVR78326.1 hypothetical protein NM96_02210 [Neisseria mucosa]